MSRRRIGRREARKEKREVRESRIVLWMVVVTLVAAFIGCLIIAFKVGDEDLKDSERAARKTVTNAPSSANR